MKTTITRQRLVALLSAILLCVGAQAQDDMPIIDGLMYMIDDENTAILVGIDESNTQTEIVIPEKIIWPNDGKTYPVTSLMAKSFWCCSNLTSVKIPSSVTSLGEWCFSGCKSLTSIEIPSSVRSLGMGCFRGCI